MQTAQQFMNIINKGHENINVICDDIVFNLYIHRSYMVQRLAVQTELGGDSTDIRRIYVPDTQLRHIAMHIVDCIERINGDAITTWHDVLLQLSNLLDEQTTQGD